MPTLVEAILAEARAAQQHLDKAAAIEATQPLSQAQHLAVQQQRAAKVHATHCSKLARAHLSSGSATHHRCKGCNLLVPTGAAPPNANRLWADSQPLLGRLRMRLCGECGYLVEGEPSLPSHRDDSRAAVAEPKEKVPSLGLGYSSPAVVSM